MNDSKAPKKLEEAHLEYLQLFLNETVELQADITAEEFITFLKSKKQIEPLFAFLEHRFPNVRNHVRLLGRHRRDLYVVGTATEKIAENLCGERMRAAKGPKSCEISDQRLYLSKFAINRIFYANLAPFSQ